MLQCAYCHNPIVESGTLTDAHIAYVGFYFAGPRAPGKSCKDSATENPETASKTLHDF